MSVNTNTNINMSSLKLVQDELVATVERAASRLEQFSKDRNDGKLLQGCIDDIKQISGTLDLIQMPGVDLLARELFEHVNNITLGEEGGPSQKIEGLTSAFFVLPRYMEYCGQTGRNLPVLLIPQINELRRARRAAPLPESYFYDYQLPSVAPRPSERPPIEEEFASLVRRLRHMYQVALLNMLQGKQQKFSLAMMGRAMQRLETACAGKPLSKLWWQASVVFAVTQGDAMQLHKERKLLFSRLDREIKRLQAQGESALDEEPPEELQKDLLYLVALSRSEQAPAQELASAYQLKALPYTDGELTKERSFLSGPSASTLSSMANELKEELRNTKNMLERAAQGGSEMLNDSPELVDTLRRVADIISVVGLISPSNSLKEEIERIESWRERDEPASAEELLSVADTLLYIESTVSGLGNMKLSEDKLAHINTLSRKDAIATNHLAEAARLVVEEAEAGLSMVKRALSSFAESNYDTGHIRNVAATLTTVRGGLVVLNLPRAAAVVEGCVNFVEQSLLQSQQEAAVEHMLETFADAVISLEYYLDSIKWDQSADDSVLQVAEESLEALGYRVKT